MSQETTVPVKSVSPTGKVVEREVPFDRERFIYDPATKELRPKVKPPAIEIAEIRQELAEVKARLEALEAMVKAVKR